MNRRYLKMNKKQLYNYCKYVIGFEDCIEVHNAFNDYSVYEAGHRFLPPDFYISVPCSRCAECRKSYRNGWAFRLITEVHNYVECTFVTLTLNDKFHTKFKDDPKRPLKLYIDRLRKELGYRPRYFFVSEYGDDIDHTGRLHYHGIIFGSSKDQLSFKLQRSKWSYGHSFFGYCNDKTCNYIVKYLLKQHGDKKSFIMCSNGIGESYLCKPNILAWHVNGFDFRDYALVGNVRYPLAPYYRNKLYNDDIKFVRMINRVWDLGPFEKFFNGRRFTELDKYLVERENFYDYTIRNRLSLTLKIPINYGKIHSATARDCEAFEVKSRFVPRQLRVF